jgi:hypothetical protein
MTETARTARTAPAPATTGRRVALALALWAGAVALVSATGWLGALPTVMVAPLVVLAIALPTLAYAANPALRAWAAGVGLWWLTALHVWRIAAAGVFFWYGGQELLPPLFVTNAGWGDLAAGLLALAVVLAPRAGRRSYAAMHLFGFADFVLAVGTGLALTLLGDPLMGTIRAFPLALIPLFGVGVSGTAHLIAFHLLWTGRGRAAGR